MKTIQPLKKRQGGNKTKGAKTNTAFAGRRLSRIAKEIYPTVDKISDEDRYEEEQWRQMKTRFSRAASLFVTIAFWIILVTAFIFVQVNAFNYIIKMIYGMPYPDA